MPVADSKLAVYEGMIALAWADHALDADEKQGLHEMIDSNIFFDDAQRQKLHSLVDNQVSLKDVWPRITDKQDRAHLLDIAHAIFAKDGNYCADEKELYETYLARHMATLDSVAVMSEIRDLAAQQRAARGAQEAELEAYSKQFSLTERLKHAVGILK